MDRLEEPQLEFEVLSNRGDHLTVQLVRGVLDDPTAILYVERWGEFELVRVVAGCPRAGASAIHAQGVAGDVAEAPRWVTG